MTLPLPARRLVFLGLAAATALVALGRVDTPAAAAPAVEATPVLVELFTSEGCSSCPPADAVLAALEQTQPVSGARVVPLGLHVDYWDRLGWADPFASGKASERQRSYASLGSGSYTPQAVIDGRAEMVGSRRAQVEAAIMDAAKRPHAKVAVALGAREPGSPFRVTVEIGALPVPARDAELVVAVTQSAAQVDVKRGENGGKTLDHTAIARDLVTGGPVPAAGATLATTMKVPPGASEKSLRIVAFVQERGSRRVLGAGTREAATP
ncbi:MAG: hypothetical protein JWP97_626 [Labilithrix sp.]|nr:hypothetical protein [Labilithrix sp.]